MKSIDEYEIVKMGYSDYGLLTIVGGGDEETPPHSRCIFFGEIGDYSAYIVDAEAYVKEYRLLESFEGWCKVYYDDGLAYEAEGEMIKVYALPESDCFVLQVIESRIAEVNEFVKRKAEHYGLDVQAIIAEDENLYPYKRYIFRGVLHFWEDLCQDAEMQARGYVVDDFTFLMRCIDDEI